MATERTRALALLVILAGAILTPSCTQRPSGFPAVEGWTQAGEVRVYNAENLWEYIDGAAVLFEEYGVRTCMTADLSAAEVAVTVDLYDMASPLEAVGVFKTESAGGGVDLTGATIAALAPPYQALMVKGSTYVKVNAYEGELTEAEGRRLLQELGTSLPGETVMPHEFSLLPEAGKVAGSEGYQPVSYLGLAELRSCLYANYETSDGEVWEGFVVLPSAAAGVWDALAERWQTLEHDGHTILFREVPYSGLVGVTRTDAGLFGVSGAANEDALLERLVGFVP